MKLLTSAAAAALLSLPAAAHDYAAGDIAIGHPFILATPPNAPVAGGYMTLRNAGEAGDVLVSASVPEEVAAKVELHEMTMAEGVMRMTPVEGGILVPAGGTVTLEPGGLHVMFMGLPEGLEAGETVPATLRFRDAGEVEVVFAVEPRGAVRGHDHGNGDHGDHDHGD